MATTQVLRGVLKPDGTLELETAPQIPAGPVEVVLHALPPTDSGQEDWWQYLQRVRAEAEAAGGPFRTEEEIEADRKDFRKGDERIEEIYRQGGTDLSGGKSGP